MGDEAVLGLERQELKALKEFFQALKDERDAIISFSLEGIVRENNRKEQILKQLEYIEARRRSSWRRPRSRRPMPAGF
jgi:flagellar biosynthesis/type III secretory pathway chaperone